MEVADAGTEGAADGVGIEGVGATKRGVTEGGGTTAAGDVEEEEEEEAAAEAECSSSRLRFKVASFSAIVGSTANLPPLDSGSSPSVRNSTDVCEPPVRNINLAGACKSIMH